MEVYVDGNRTSSENWLRAQTAPIEELPPLTEGEKIVAGKFGQTDETYARTLYAGDLERVNLGQKAVKAARILERFASQKAPGVQVDRVWLKTFEGKFRFDISLNGSSTLISISEELLDDLLEKGSRSAEEGISRIIEFNLPASWTAHAS